MSSDGWLSPLAGSTPGSDEGVTSSVLAYTRAEREAGTSAAAKGKRKRILSTAGGLAGVDAGIAAAPAGALPPTSAAARAAAAAVTHPSDPAYGDAVLAMCGGAAGAAALDAAFLGAATDPSPASPSAAAAAAAAAGGGEPVASHLARAFTQWGAALAALQPKCVVGPAGVARGLRVLARYIAARGPGPIAMAEAAAAFWVAVKVEGTRSAVPSRALLARATAVPPADLSSAEIGLLCAVAFDVFGGDIAAEEEEEEAVDVPGPAAMEVAAW